jgi:xylono-1,5-lactonase
MNAMQQVRCVCDVKAVLGEGPIWSARDNAIYWVDIKRPAVHRYRLNDATLSSWPMPEYVCWLIERRTSGFIAGFRSGFAKLTLEPLSIEPIGAPEPNLPGNRMNDAKADAQGRIWAGTMDDAEVQESGSLYRLDPDLHWHTADTGYHITNGPALGADGKTLYHTDSGKRSIYVFALAADGTLHDKRLFIRFDNTQGYPDGMTVDAQGGLWVAHWGGSRVSRFHRDGRLDRSIALPVSQVTSCVFGGASLERMFVTSASIGLRSEKLACEPLAGGLFEVDPQGSNGLPAAQFAG